MREGGEGRTQDSRSRIRFRFGRPSRPVRTPISWGLFPGVRGGVVPLYLRIQPSTPRPPPRTKPASTFSVSQKLFRIPLVVRASCLAITDPQNSAPSRLCIECIPSNFRLRCRSPPSSRRVEVLKWRRRSLGRSSSRLVHLEMKASKGFPFPSVGGSTFSLDSLRESRKGA